MPAESFQEPAGDSVAAVEGNLYGANTESLLPTAVDSSWGTSDEEDDAIQESHPNEAVCVEEQPTDGESWRWADPVFAHSLSLIVSYELSLLTPTN